MKEIEIIFKLLEKWHKFPKYQLERRLDIFFALYLPEILKKVPNINIEVTHNDISPEFPLKKNNSCSSTNVDYAIFSNENGKIKLYLLELKTDMNSIDNEQITYYKKAKEKGFSQILTDIIKVQRKSPQWKKYDNLLDYIEKNNYDIIRNTTSIGSQKRKNWEIVKENIIEEIEIIYLVPKEDERIRQYKIITFENVINIIKNNHDNISVEFCKILKELI